MFWLQHYHFLISETFFEVSFEEENQFYHKKIQILKPFSFISFIFPRPVLELKENSSLKSLQNNKKIPGNIEILKKMSKTDLLIRNS